MSKVIVTRSVNGVCVDFEQFKTDMTPLEVKKLLQTPEQNIADLKMKKFRKGGDTA